MVSDSNNAEALPSELAEELSNRYGIELSLSERIAEDVLLYFNDTVEEWVRSRHYRLQHRGLKNEDIYRKISEEILERRFASRPLSIRQIRRMIYG